MSRKMRAKKKRVRKEVLQEDSRGRSTPQKKNLKEKLTGK